MISQGKQKVKLTPEQRSLFNRFRTNYPPKTLRAIEGGRISFDELIIDFRECLKCGEPTTAEEICDRCSGRMAKTGTCEVLRQLLTGPKNSNQLFEGMGSKGRLIANYVNSLRSLGCVIGTSYLNTRDNIAINQDYRDTGCATFELLDYAPMYELPKGSYYTTNHWLSIASLRREFDGYRCVCCRLSSRELADRRQDPILRVHHQHYDYFKEELRHLLTVCDGCHDDIHKWLRIAAPRLVPYEVLLRVAEDQVSIPAAEILKQASKPIDLPLQRRADLHGYLSSPSVLPFKVKGTQATIGEIASRVWESYCGTTISKKIETEAKKEVNVRSSIYSNAEDHNVPKQLVDDFLDTGETDRLSVAYVVAKAIPQTLDGLFMFGPHTSKHEPKEQEK